MICFVLRQTSSKMIYPVTRIPQQIAILTQILTLELAQTILLIDGNDKQATINSPLKAYIACLNCKMRMTQTQDSRRRINFHLFAEELRRL